MGHVPDEGAVLASAGSGLARTGDQRALASGEFVNGDARRAGAVGGVVEQAAPGPDATDLETFRCCSPG
jgi:hypothetical protein